MARLAPPEPLYVRVLGDEFSRLAAVVQRFHRLQGRHELRGWVRVHRPASRPARCLARLLGTPRHAQGGPFDFTLDATPPRETWTRYLPNGVMRSTLEQSGVLLAERLGPARLTYRLRAKEGRLSMHLHELRFFGIPCPGWLRPDVLAQESGSAAHPQRFCFFIRASVPLLGQVAAYDGYLDLPSDVDSSTPA